MYSVILAGGFGTRLRQIIENVPKPMAPIGEKVFIEYIIKNLKDNGISECALCLYYLSEMIVNYLGDGSKYGVKIDYSIEREPMGTGGAVGLLRDVLKETFCVVNGDTYLRLSVDDCIKKHKERGALATIALASVSNNDRYGKVELDEEGYIIDFLEKKAYMENNEESALINAGFYIFEPEILNYIKEHGFVSIEKDVFPELIKRKQRIYGYSETSDFFDIGIPNDYYAFKAFMSVD